MSTLQTEATLGLVVHPSAGDKGKDLGHAAPSECDGPDCDFRF